MTKEQEVVDFLKEDATLLALLPGGIYTDQEIGIEGIRRGDDVTGGAFDAAGKLKATAVVRQRGTYPFGAGDIRSISEKIVAVSQVIEIYYFENRGQEEIEPAKNRVFTLLEGHRLPDSYQMWWTGDTPYFYDAGPVANSTVMRQEWQVIGMKRGS